VVRRLVGYDHYEGMQGWQAFERVWKQIRIQLQIDLKPMDKIILKYFKTNTWENSLIANYELSSAVSGSGGKNQHDHFKKAKP
jgi:hypothetical protein